MTDTERRALLEHYAEQLSALNVELFPGSGIMRKDRILVILERMTELAQELSE